MLHHHPTSADMWDHYTDAPRRPAFVRRRLHRTHLQLLLPTPCPTPSPRAAPHRAWPALSTAGRASSRQAWPPTVDHASSHQASLHRRRLRLLAPCRPTLPLAARLHAELASEHSSRRCRTGKMRSSATPPRLAARGHPCLLSQSQSPSPALPAVATPPGCCPLSLRALPLPEQPLPATTAIPTATVAPSPTASHSPPATDASLPLPTPTLSLLRRLWPDPLLGAPDPATGWLDPSTVTPDPRHPPPPLKS
ncbi:hypothetical protein OsI_12830 [Oryza sativa Indica Group]|uniref:Uncharacterized protein n=1 Tax=Oryza sativa subsp. indica TaxID=39946 RepID=B8ANI9_ORYSI|nr:hypothetical protein OsI_12830 [Oryza sativa Indica Group]